MIRELDSVTLVRDLPEHSLKRGDSGTVVFCHGKGEAFEVEFFDSEGDTVAVVTVAAGDLQPLPA